MIILYLLLIPIFYILIRVILYLIVRKYGKFSYDGFSAGGFMYAPEKDIFYSTKNAWQKNFGYTHMYDVLAPLFRMIIDTEPIKFYYNNKNWLITFWKGQYGIVTGAEVGIYCTNQKMVNKKTVYLPVSDSEMLNIDLRLYKKGKLITKVNAKHWWLAIFKLGMFSWPEDLFLDINITFLDQQMLDAFLESFKKLGYTSKDFKVIDNTFCFKYISPHSHKVWTRTLITDKISQFWNCKNVELYNKCLVDLIDDNKIDDSKGDNNKDLIIINELLPDLVKNDLEDQNRSGIITKKVLNEKNVVLLDSDSYFESSLNKL